MKFIDLSHPISNDTKTYPTDPKISIVKEKGINRNNSLLHSFKMGTHTGTHLDVPAHILPNGKTLDNYSLKYFSGLTVKVDKDSIDSLSKIKKNIDGLIYETGWFNNFNNPDIFYGKDRPTIPLKLIKKVIAMNINFFGCDLPSVDKSESVDKKVHHNLLYSDIIIYESLTNLNQLPLLKPFHFYGFPLPFIGLDGSPIRAVGIIN